MHIRQWRESHRQNSGTGSTGDTLGLLEPQPIPIAQSELESNNKNIADSSVLELELPLESDSNDEDDDDLDFCLSLMDSQLKCVHVDPRLLCKLFLGVQRMMFLQAANPGNRNCDVSNAKSRRYVPF